MICQLEIKYPNLKWLFITQRYRVRYMNKSWQVNLKSSIQNSSNLQSSAGSLDVLPSTWYTLCMRMDLHDKGIYMENIHLRKLVWLLVEMYTLQWHCVGPFYCLLTLSPVVFHFFSSFIWENIVCGLRESPTLQVCLCIRKLMC